MSLQNSHFSYTVNKTCLREKIMDMAKCPLDKEISRTRREPGLFIWTMKEWPTRHFRGIWACCVRHKHSMPGSWMHRVFSLVPRVPVDMGVCYPGMLQVSALSPFWCSTFGHCTGDSGRPRFKSDHCSGEGSCKAWQNFCGQEKCMSCGDKIIFTESARMSQKALGHSWIRSGARLMPWAFARTVCLGIGEERPLRRPTIWAMPRIVKVRTTPRFFTPGLHTDRATSIGYYIRRAIGTHLHL